MTKKVNKPDYYADKKWYEDRNERLLQDRFHGVSIKKLIIKYNLSYARIYEIIKKGKFNASKEFTK